MNRHTNIQIIEQDGKPAFAVVPYDEWEKLINDPKKADTIPHDVMGFIIKDGVSPIDAWRRYKKITQTELGSKMGGLSQSAISQLLKSDRPQKKTLERAAKALNINPKQLKI
ncbi:MAG: transcriptional regulator [SAR86 cluster bacterium]|uniref:Transcriptional regulator n=1 Tax=SAR86 cluster bacterium TaxID=2030880 RepID=A0A2A5CGH9_9GAMM|nr:helix-turn-helix transcriptional regulator [Gammaproteobacteria bacterium AH-315-E17]PCJ42638.1 MAG: transcriptional regulator [SAR86 cluster bacterium]